MLKCGSPPVRAKKGCIAAEDFRALQGRKIPWEPHDAMPLKLLPGSLLTPASATVFIIQMWLSWRQAIHGEGKIRLSGGLATAMCQIREGSIGS
jgi:hypothetical protein